MVPNRIEIGNSENCPTKNRIRSSIKDGMKPGKTLSKKKSNSASHI